MDDSRTADPKELEFLDVSAQELSTHLQALESLLRSNVEDGANINFILPFSQSVAADYWRNSVLPALRKGKRKLWIARIEDATTAQVICGTVQLNLDTPPNQVHRAEITKLLVHPAYRRRGIARKLMLEAENQAQKLGRSLITLDTTTGSAAESLYLSMGYISLGAIPSYARDPKEDRLDPATVFYKQL